MVQFLDLLVEFLQVLGTTNLLSLKQSHRTAGETETTAGVLAALRDKRIVVILGNDFSVTFNKVYAIEDEGHELAILRIELNHLCGGVRIGIDLRRVRREFLETVKDEEVRLSFAGVAEDVYGFVCLRLVVNDVEVEVGFEVVLYRNAVFLWTSEDVGEEGSILRPVYLLLQELDRFGKPFQVLDE